MGYSMSGGIGDTHTYMTPSLGGLEDILTKDLSAVFCEINPGLFAAVHG